MIINLESSTLQETIGTASAIVDFWAPWCNPCKAINAELEKVNQTRPDITIVKVNVDNHQELVREYHIKSVPTVLFIRDGGAPTSVAGLIRAEEMIKKVSR
jgi:thioredoxin 1